MYRVAIWSQSIAPGKRIRIFPEADVKVTTATFGEEFADEKGRSTIKLYRAKLPPPKAFDDEDDEVEEEESDDEKPLEFEQDAVILGHLLPGKIESQLLDLIILEDDPIELEVTGKNVVQLYGNFVDQNPNREGFPDGLDSEEDYGEEDDYDLDEVSSDVMDMDTAMINGVDDSESADELHGRIEELAPAPEPPKQEKQSKKRARESDATEAAAEDQSSEKKSKKQKKAEKKAAAAAAAAAGDVNGASTTAGDGASTSSTLKSSAPSKSETTSKKEKAAEPPTPIKDLTKAIDSPKATPSGAKATTDETSAKKEEGKTSKKGPVESRTTKSGTKIEVFNKGTGAVVKAGNKVTMRYIGKLENKSVFDKNVAGKPFTFTAGKGEVIKGWDEGIVGLTVGSEALLTVPPSAGYGNKKSGPIPANSTLKFEVKVLSAA